MGQKPIPQTSTPKTLEAPLHPLLLSRDNSADEALTWLMLAAEALAAPRCGLQFSLEVEHALSADSPAVPPDSFEWLSELAGHITATVEANAQRSQVLERMPATFASAWGMQALFRALFPEARSSIHHPAHGATLSEREREVLRQVSKGVSHEDISRALGIAPRTVDRHMENIYTKLGVNKPANAVARAIALGLLDVDPSNIVRYVAGSIDRSAQVVDTFCQGVGALDSHPEMADLKQLAGFAIMMLALSGAMSRQLLADSPKVVSRGIILLLDGQGTVKRKFGSDRMGSAHSIVLAPAHAKAAGLTPDHLFIAHNLYPQQGLNRAAVSEYTPYGRYVRTFCGSRHLATRMVGPLSLAFARDGRLLATSGWLTDGILAFSEGGQVVSRFADGLYGQIAVGKNGNVYAVQHTDGCDAIRVFEPDGQPLSLLAGGFKDHWYSAIAVASPDKLCVGKRHNERTTLQFLTMDGEVLSEHDIPGIGAGHLASNGTRQIYIACKDERVIKIIGEDGAIRQCLPLGRQIVPHHTAIGADGRLWVCGRVC